MADRAASRTAKPKGSYDSASGYWLVPVSDSMLDMLRGQWSPLVQLKAETSDGGLTYDLRVRELGGVNVERILIALEWTQPHGFNRTAARTAIEDVLRAARPTA